MVDITLMREYNKSMNSFLANRIAFSIGNFDVYYYGLIITSAIILAFGLAFLFCKKRGFNKDFPFDLLLAVVPLGIVGARLFYIAFDSSLTIADFFLFREGGMSILGSLIGGAIGLCILCLYRKKNFFDIADVLVPLVLMCQAIGRWGNFFNEEVYGALITDPAMQWFPLAVNIGGEFYQALFFYEFVLNTIGTILLIVLLYKVKQRGIVLGAYLVWYGTVRFSLETLRQPEYILKWGTIPASQLFSGIMIVIGIALLVTFIIIAVKKKKAIAGGRTGV
ncbi:MAG: prolipoprotein diacylglyceryl transferase [Clostridia bacterium]